jgi:hypothetical protein
VERGKVDDLREEGAEASFGIVNGRGEGLDRGDGGELASEGLGDELADLRGGEFGRFGEEVGKFGESGLRRRGKRSVERRRGKGIQGAPPSSYLLHLRRRPPRELVPFRRCRGRRYR